MARNKYTKKQNDEIYKRLYSVLLRYGSAKVIVGRRAGTDYGQRFVKKSGKSKVSYMHQHSTNEHYKKRYSQSCFVEEYTDDYCKCCGKKKLNLARTLKEMRSHDGNWLHIKEVQYGPGFKKRMKLI